MGVNLLKQQQLEQYIEQLRAAVASVDTSAQDRRHLSEVIAAIETGMNDTAAVDASVVRSLERLVAGFERDHPRLAAILNNILLSLSNMGV